MTKEIDFSDVIDEVISAQPERNPNNYSQEIDDVMGNDLKSSMQYAVKQNPDQATKQLQLAKQSRVPFQVVVNRENSVRQTTDFNSIDFNNLQNEFPKLSEKLTDPAQASAIRDDIANLSYFERIVKSTQQEYKQARGDVDASNIRLKEMIFDVSGNKSFEPTPIERNSLNLIDKNQSQRKDYNLGFIGSIPSYTAAAIPTILDTAPQTLGGTAIGATAGLLIGRNPAAAGVGAIWGSRAGTAYGVGKLETGLAYQELKNLTDENGKLIEKPVAAGAAIATGMVNGLLELVPFEAATAPIRRAFSKEAMRKIATSQAGKEYLKDIGNLMLAEGVTEGLQELSSVAFVEFAKGASDGNFKTLGMKDAEDTEGLLKFLSENSKRILDSAKAGAGAGLGIGGFTGGVTYARKAYNENQQYKNEQEQISNQLDKVKESKVFQRDSELFKEVTNDTLGEQKIYIPAQQFQEFFQSQKKLTEFLAAVPEAKQQLDEAVEVGGNLVLPSNSVLTAIAKDPELSGLQPLMKLNPASLSDAEFKELYSPDFLKDFTETENKDLTRGEEIQKRIESQAAQSGLTPDSSRLYANAFRAFYDTQSHRLGNSEEGRKILDQAFERLKIQSGQSESIGEGKTFRQSRLKDLIDIQEKTNQELKDFLIKNDIKVSEGKFDVTTATKDLTDNQKLEFAAQQEKITEKFLDKYFEDRKDMFSPKPKSAEKLQKVGVGNKVKTLFQSGFGIIKTDQDMQIKILDKYLKQTLGIKPKNNEERATAYHALKPSQQLEIIRRQEERIAKNLDEYLKESKENKKDTSTTNKRYFQSEQEQGNNRGSIQFDTPTGETIISLFEGRDLSTLLHESGHFFLETQRAISSLENAPEQIKNDWTKTLEWLGSTDGNLTTEQHEQFARGFEAYLYKGEAPSIELRNVFQRFKAWLVRIYKDVKSLDVKVSKQMSEIFDRMLATDEQIEALKTDPLFKPDPKISEMLTSAEREDYIKRNEKALQESKEKLMKKALRQIERKNKKWWKEAKEKLTNEITERFNKSPVYRATHFLKTGKFLDKETPSTVKPFKMSEKAIKDRFEFFGENKDLIKSLPSGILSKDGVDPEVVAEAFNFSSADEMFSAMVGMKNMDAAITEAVDEEMFNRYGDMMEDGSLEREALNVMQNSDRANQIAFELDTIGRKIGGLKESKESYKMKAKEVIGAKKIDDAIKPSQYYVAEVRAARAAGKALGQKDYIKAAKFKREQLLNHYLYKESEQARVETNKALKRFSKYQKAQTPGNVRIDEDYRLKIVELLSNYRLAPRPTAETKLTREALEAWQNDKTNKDGADFIAPVFSDKTHYRDLTLTEFQSLDDTVENIATQGRSLRSILVEGKKMELAEIAKEVSKTIEENIDPKPQPINTRDRIADNKFKLENFFFSTIKARTFLREMDGFKDLGTVQNYIMKPIDAAEIAKTKRMRTVATEMDNIIKKHYPKGISKQKVHVPEIGESISKESMIAVALNWGNEDNKVKLMEGRKWTEAQVQAILDRLTENDWQFVQNTWNYLNSFWPEIAELQKRRTGVAPDKVINSPISISTSDNKTISLDGGYYPLKYDERISSEVHNPLSETLSQMVKTFSKPQTRRGHTKERVNGVDKPVRLDMAPLFDHLNSVVTDLTMGEALENSYKILNKSTVRKAITDTLGINAFRQLDMWLKDLAVGGSLGSSAFDSAMDGLRAGVSISVMGFKVTTVLTQLTGFSHSFVKLGPKYMLKGIAKFLGGGNPMQINRNAAFVQEKSEFMQNRSTTFHRDVNDALRLMQKKGEIRGAIAKAAFWPIVKMQMMVDTPTWLGAYEKGLKDYNGDDRKAVEFADSIVIQAQGSGLTKDLSGFERGTTSEATRLSPYVRLFTTFYSYFNTKLNIAYEQTKKTDFSKPKDVARLASDYLMLFWVEAVVGEYLLGRAPDFDDDDDNALWWSMKLALQSIGSTLPIVREITAGLEGFSSYPAGLRGLEEVTGAIKTVGQTAAAIADEDKEVDISKVIISLNDAGGIIFKYPSAQINVALRAMERAEKGEDVAPVDYLIYRKNK